MYSLRSENLHAHVVAFQTELGKDILRGVPTKTRDTVLVDLNLPFSASSFIRALELPQEPPLDPPREVRI